MNHLASSLISLCLLLSSGSPPQSVPPTAEVRAIRVEEKEARELAIQFTIRFTETQDLGPIIRDFYFSDFVERYKSFKTKELNTKTVDLYFAPGLDYNSQLLVVANSKDWEGFYLATNNFLLLGFISALAGSVQSKCLGLLHPKVKWELDETEMMVIAGNAPRDLGNGSEGRPPPFANRRTSRLHLFTPISAFFHSTPTPFSKYTCPANRRES